ncbi:MAG: NAD+ synthase [Phycisphaerales bacterium]
MRIALCTINPTVGDLTFNADLIRLAAKNAAVQGADVALLPELALSGYPPKDLLSQQGFIDSCLEHAQAIARDLAKDDTTKSLTLIFGTPLRRSRDGANTNSLLVCSKGVITHRYDKQLLPTYDVFDEDRYFEPGDNDVVIDVVSKNSPHHTLRIGLTICEDLWKGEDAGFSSRYANNTDPVAQLVEKGAKVILSASASPFVLGKGQKHRDILAGHAKRHGVIVASVNQLGANDELIFDGHRYVFSSRGELAATGNLFDDSLLVFDIESDTAGGSISPQRHRDTEIEREENKWDVSARTFASPMSSPSHRLTVSPSQPASGTAHSASSAEHLFHALVCGIRDYLRKTGFKSALIGLSGGIDSALTAALAVAAIGQQNVLGLAMPGPYSSQHSIDDALDLAKRLDMRCDVVPIEKPMEGFRTTVDNEFSSLTTKRLGESLPDLTEENLQSRIRGTMLMTVSNRTGAIVLTTGNKSEMAVGYATLYGDMNGGLAVLSDVTKHWVYELSRYINEHYKMLPGLSHCTKPPIPENTIHKPPSAELRPNQTDQDSLPPYDTLDEIIARYIERHQSATTIAKETNFDIALVKKITRMIDIAEYKRRQAAVGLKVTTVAFGTGRRYPIAQNWRTS